MLFRSMSEYSKLSKDERFMYDISIQNKWDSINALNYAKKCAEEEGLKEGLEKGMEKGLKKGREEGMEKGKQEGRKEGIEEGMEKSRQEFISNLIRKSQMTDTEIAEIAGIEVELVKSIRQNLLLK